jgi:hypothetical protein
MRAMAFMGTAYRTAVAWVVKAATRGGRVPNYRRAAPCDSGAPAALEEAEKKHAFEKAYVLNKRKNREEGGFHAEAQHPRPGVWNKKEIAEGGEALHAFAGNLVVEGVHRKESSGLPGGGKAKIAL